MKDAPGPTIDLTPERVMCGRHAEVFRSRWPMGYPAFVLEGFKALMEDEQFGKETHGHQEEITPALDRLPICCRLTRPRLMLLYEKVQELMPVFVTGACELCRVVALGSPYKAIMGSRLRTFDHLCLRCVIENLETGARPPYWRK